MNARLLGLMVAGASAAALCRTANSATVSATSGDVSVDTQLVKECPVGTSLTIPYDAQWCCGSAAIANGRVTVVAVIDEGATNRTSTIASCAADPGTCSYLRASDAPGTVRFKLAYYDGEGTQVGEALSCDVTHYLSVGDGTEVCVDSRTNSLQTVAEAGGPAILTFDRAWVTNGTAARVEMHCVCDQRRKDGTLVSSVTNEIFQSDEQDIGSFSHGIDPGNGGTFTLYCSFFDGEGNLLEAPLSASYYFREKFGMMLMLK